MYCLLNMFTYICINKQKQKKMLITKTIKQMDTEFATEAGMSYEKFTSLTIMEQSKIKRTITNKRLKNRNK